MLINLRVPTLNIRNDLDYRIFWTIKKVLGNRIAKRSALKNSIFFILGYLGC
jgi:hypothetical protein